MSFQVTESAQNKIDAQNKKPSMVLEIDGYDYKFSLSTLERLIRVGDVGLEIDGSWVIGGSQQDQSVLPYISIDGTTQTISQQMQQDKGGATSVSSIQISLIDYRQAITRLVSPGVELTDLLGRKAYVWLGFQETNFPEDHFILFSGIIDEISATGNIILNIAHPEQNKRQEIFKQYTTTLAAQVRYKSITVQDLQFVADPQSSGTVRIRYVVGGTAGSEVVTVSGNDISVQIESGVSTADQIRQKLRSNASVAALLDDVAVIDTGNGSTAQVAFAYTDIDSSTVIGVVDVGTLLAEYLTEFLTYVKINDEIIRYTTINSGTNELTISERGCFGTIPQNHEVEDDVVSFYRLIGNSNDLALKVLLSGPDEYWVEDIGVDNFVRSASGVDTADTFFIAAVDVKQKYGLSVGDLFTTTGSPNAANNVSLQTVSSIEVSDNGSIVTASGAGFVVETNSPAVVKFKSQYNVLPDGLGLPADEVDVAEFNRINDMVPSYLPDYDFYLTDTINGKDFVDKQLLYPANMYSLPRKGRVSVGYISPPLAVETLPIIDSRNIISPEKIQIKRTLGRYFYNTLIYKYDFDAVETSKPLAGYIRTDADSKNRIPVGTKSLVITSQGLRNTASTTTILDIASVRALERYKYAAEMITLSCFYGVGFTVEVGDIVYFGDEDLRILDSKQGVRGFSPRLCEVVDKKMNIATGRVDLVIVDTGYATDGRYGTWSPSSLLGSGSTVTELVLTKSYGTETFEIEKDKWVRYIGEDILVRSLDWSVSYTTTIRGFDPADPTIMWIDPIGGAPPAGYIVDIIQYPADSNPAVAAKYKAAHCFFDPTIAIATGVSQTVFTVSAPNALLLFVGATIKVHDDDFSDESPEVKITDITGTTVTVDTALGFIPSSVHDIELIGFVADEGSAFRWL